MPNSKALMLDDVIDRMQSIREKYGNIPAMVETGTDILYITNLEYDVFTQKEGKVLVIELEDDDD